MTRWRDENPSVLPLPANLTVPSRTAWTGVPTEAGRSMPSWKSYLPLLIRGPNDVFIESGVVVPLSGQTNLMVAPPYCCSLPSFLPDRPTGQGLGDARYCRR